MKECTAVLSSRDSNPDPVARAYPPVLPDGTFCLGFEIRYKMAPAEMEAGIALEDDGRAAAFAAGDIWQSDQPLFPV
jgi:hypothetical protein